MYLFALAILISMLPSFDDSPAENQDYSSIELVMNDGASIEAGNAGKMIKISAQGLLERTYEWGKCSLSTTLTVRASRWYGSLGAYDPSASFGFSLNECEGISRSVVQEGQIHFGDEEFAMEWIHRRPAFYATAWAENGLLVSWSLTPERTQLNVDIWLMCLKGKPYNFSSETSGLKLLAISNHKNQPIRKCKKVGWDVIDDTRRQIEEDWAKYDALFPKRKHLNDLEKLNLLNQ